LFLYLENICLYFLPKLLFLKKGDGPQKLDNVLSSKSAKIERS